IVRNLAAVARGRPGLLARLRAHAESLQIELEEQLPAEFSILFPSERGAYVRDQAIALAKVRDLADRWVPDRPELVVERIRGAELEAAAAGISWPRFTPSLCSNLAESTSNPGCFVAEMVA